MKKLIIGLFTLAIITGLILVSCNSEVKNSTVSVSFAPSTTKSINQSGTSQSTENENVDLYHWEYAYVQDTSIKVSDSLTWTEFYTDKSKTGLGNINGLVKGSTYSFALRGYTTGTDGVLIWEGSTESGTTLSSKKTVIKVNVYPKGKGMIYFDISAPVVSSEITTSGTDYVCENSDKFKISWVKIGDSSVADSEFVETEINKDGEEFVYNTIGGSALTLSSGSYLFTIQQYEYDSETSSTDNYTAIEQRKQVLIVNAISGMDTVISGSLDSTALNCFDYNAGSTEKEYGLDVEFMQKEGDLSLLPVKAKNASGVEKYIRQYERVFVYDNEYLTIDFSSASDTYSIYVNGCLVDPNVTESVYDSHLDKNFYKKQFTTDTDEVEPTSECSYLREYDSINKTIKAYGKVNCDYLVTITSGKQSKTFTIVGRNDYLNTYTAIIKLSEYELLTTTSDIIEMSHYKQAGNPDDIDISATITREDALSLLNSMIPENEKNSDKKKNFITITLKVIEKELTVEKAEYDISLPLSAEVVNNENKQTYLYDEDLHIADDYVTVKISSMAHLKDMSISHKVGDTFYAMTELDDISTGTTATDLNNAGFFSYDAETGVYSIRTRSFSPFKSVYKQAKQVTVRFFVGDEEYSKQTVWEGQKVKYLSKEKSYKDNNISAWNIGSQTGETWDFDDKVYEDMNLYANWIEPTVKYYDSSSTLLAEVEHKYRSLLQEVPSIDVTNSILLGWNTESDGTGDWVDLNTYKVTEDISLYALTGDKYELDYFSPVLEAMLEVYFSDPQLFNNEYYDNGIPKSYEYISYIPSGAKLYLMDDPNNNKWGYPILRVTYGSNYFDRIVVTPNKCTELTVYKDFFRAWGLDNESNKNAQIIGSIQLNGEAYVFDLNKTIMLYPDYDVTVTYDLNYDDCPASYTKTYCFYDYLSSTDIPERESFNFLGWCTTKEYNADNIFDSENTHLYKDISLYAQWAPPFTVEIDDTLSVYASYSDSIKYTVSPTDLEDYTLSWSSSDTTVATVDTNGLVKGLKAGTATITATLTQDGHSTTDTCTVTVIAGSTVSITFKDTETSSKPTWTVTLGTSPRWKDILSVGTFGNYEFTTDADGYIIFKNKGVDVSKSEGSNVFYVYKEKTTKFKSDESVTSGSTYSLKRLSIQLSYYGTSYKTVDKTIYVDANFCTKFSELVNKTFTAGSTTYTWGKWTDIYEVTTKYDETFLVLNDCIYLKSGSNTYVLYDSNYQPISISKVNAINFGTPYKLFPVVDITVKSSNSLWIRNFRTSLDYEETVIQDDVNTELKQIVFHMIKYDTVASTFSTGLANLDYLYLKSIDGYKSYHITDNEGTPTYPSGYTTNTKVTGAITITI